jgi:predicted small secreted protein
MEHRFVRALVAALAITVAGCATIRPFRPNHRH